MSVRFFPWRLQQMCLAFLLCGGFCTVLPANDKVTGATRDIEFAPEPVGGITNSISPVVQPSSAFLNDVEAPGGMQLNPRPTTFRPAPSRPVVMPSRRARELQDARENWAFTTPEEMMESYMLERLSKSSDFGANGQEKESYSAVERYYERMSHEREALSGAAATGLSINDIVSQWQGNPRLLGDGSPNVSFMPDLSNGYGGTGGIPGMAPPGADARTFELLGIRNPLITQEEQRMQQMQEQRIRDFRRLLDQPFEGNAGLGILPENPSQPFSSMDAQAPLPAFGVRPGVPTFAAPTLNTDPRLPMGPLAPSSPIISDPDSFDPVTPPATAGRINPSAMPSFVPPKRAF